MTLAELISKVESELCKRDAEDIGYANVELRTADDLPIVEVDIRISGCTDYRADVAVVYLSDE